MKRPLAPAEVKDLTVKLARQGQFYYREGARLLDHVATLEALLDSVADAFPIGWRDDHRLSQSAEWAISPTGGFVPITAEELLALTHIPDEGYVNEILREMEAERQ